ncbi:MAG: phosphoribosylglycinamide formyltransferase [Rhizobiaceae bacterium]|nr:phosphoribosylglycinamide formyltransferase [Rhizobiaceae bacterium]
MQPKRTVIMISGRGSNMAALVEAAAEHGHPAKIVGVLSDKAEAPGLDYAARAGIATRVVARADYASADLHDGAIDEALEELGAELVCLAGYMRKLSPGFVRKWLGRVINIHPSLLPLFRGLNSHRQALEAGVRIHGCTVHFVTPAIDAGPIIAQAAVPVLPDDSEETLAARVLAMEHKLYPRALRLVAEGKVQMQGERTAFQGFRVLRESSDRALFAPEPDTGVVDVESLARFTP